ncbi:hypothetical protein L226DRAFT_329112 [Lentinus tigrinus ALCF2SS1-7]|uniref:Uncharacterized protein n=1 Tax=Lentinus tigrinus ALCF2SS1-6 TaxID=1328759 RepID=A0A5C2SH01_9APHY|nr:hypothetical protein L227DRAFT_429301 [Lentinus tigrinus ALCF2SS1-6]RPD77683.1 hypothetical protein L226DRAFT_329112 [Lentinus tigrinus ALCF2SS1-7]
MGFQAGGPSGDGAQPAAASLVLSPRVLLTYPPTHPARCTDRRREEPIAGAVRAEDRIIGRDDPRTGTTTSDDGQHLTAVSPTPRNSTGLVADAACPQSHLGCSGTLRLTLRCACPTDGFTSLHSPRGPRRGGRAVS